MPQANHLHEAPKTPAERLAHHLEVDYGLQLDPGRHKALIGELDAFLGNQAPISAESVAPAKETEGE